MEQIWHDPRYIGKAFTEKARELGFTKEEIKEFIRRQEGAQLTKQRAPVEYFPIWGPPGSYQADLLFIDTGQKNPILSVIDINSKYAYAYLLKSKSAPDVAAAMAKFLRDCKTRSECHFLQTDNGNEFLNSAVNKVLADVAHSTVDVGDHRGQSVVERFNQTLRRLITLYTDATDLDWKKVLSALVENYNHRKQLGIGMKPADADDLTGFAKKGLQYDAAKAQFDKIKVGDTVRKLLNRDTFDKGRQRWSKQEYEIVGVDHNRFLLNDGSKLRHYELQVIPKDTVKTVRRDVDEERKALKKLGKQKRAQKKSGVAENKDTFDGNQFVGRKVRVPAWHFDEYKGNRDYVLTFFGGKVVSYKKSRGDPRKNYDWTVEYEGGGTETMNLAELERFSS